LTPVKAIAEAKPIRIKTIQTFNVQLPATPTEVGAGVMRRMGVNLVTTESGVRGYSFGPPGTGASVPDAPKPSEGARCHDWRRLVCRGTSEAGLIYWGGIEEAVWDAIGKVAGQPVLSLAWWFESQYPGLYHGCLAGQCGPVAGSYQGSGSLWHAPPGCGFHRASRFGSSAFPCPIRSRQPNFMDDVEACAGIVAACRAGFKVMVDRTAHLSGKVWDYATGLAAAKALQQAGVYWLEEPFARDDFEGPARLAREVEILITGGEGFRGLDSYRECLCTIRMMLFSPTFGRLAACWQRGR
jgi:L-alanine-DL-glutamate epimerase-like enolase superfamily enzyme